jgi:hypothetical protein
MGIHAGCNERQTETATGSAAVSIAHPEPNKCSGNIKDLPDGSRTPGRKKGDGMITTSGDGTV